MEIMVLLNSTNSSIEWVPKSSFYRGTGVSFHFIDPSSMEDAKTTTCAWTKDLLSNEQAALLNPLVSVDLRNSIKQHSFQSTGSIFNIQYIMYIVYYIRLKA